MKCRESRRLMDRYLQNDLAEPLLEEFERHYIDCHSCFSELRVREKLACKEIRIPAPDRPKFFAFKPVLVFSSLFLVIGAALFMVHMQKIRFYDRLSRFDPPIFISSQLRNYQPSDSEIEAAFARAMEFYNQERYRDALDILLPLRPNRLPHPKLSFFTGICQLLEDHPTDAIVMFDSIIRTMDPSYFDEAIYYKGIALLRLRKKEEAIGQFRNLTGMVSPMSFQAREMIEKISGR